MSHMYGFWCVQFFFLKNRLSKILFSNPFPKKRSDCESQKSGSTLSFYEFMIRFWICPKKNAKSVFGFGNPHLDFPKKKHPKCRYFHLSVHVVVELSSNTECEGTGDFGGGQKMRYQNLVGMDLAVDTLGNTVSIPEGHVWSIA